MQIEGNPKVALRASLINDENNKLRHALVKPRYYQLGRSIKITLSKVSFLNDDILSFHEYSNALAIILVLFIHDPPTNPLRHTLIAKVVFLTRGGGVDSF